ncbi:hypothetical protein Sste5346_003591 [Sporothrix stenoceras]|uniref:Uncharacterized protein n=1 Tax=Sporothrix stenoceras TaxID=5173 RepID=A0ABR3ZDR3_9PEZI
MGIDKIKEAVRELAKLNRGDTSTAIKSESEDNEDSQATQLSEFSGERRFASYQAAVVNALGGGKWMSITLESTTDNHTMPDIDLGSG